MMDIFYDPTDGSVLFTISGDEPHRLEGWSITVPDCDLGDLTGWRVVDGVLESHDLAPAKETAMRAVNAAMGQARLSLMTDIPGQTAIYAAKEAEARAWLAMQAVNLDACPFLAAEALATGHPPRDIAALWLRRAFETNTALAEIEGRRTTLFQQINTATSRDQIDAVLATITPT
jgi:hypothetical protein